MKHLLLLRHAKSSWKDFSLPDHDRGLNKRGKLSAPLMGNKLSIKSIQPQLIISSTAKRALKTAKLIAKEINYSEIDIKTNRNLFHASPETITNIISQCDDSIQKLMLVGHNPGVTGFANLLLNKIQFNNIPTAGLITFSIDINNWKELLSQQSIQSLNVNLLDYDYPKLIDSNN